mmetsp:Transcript_49942/g.108563  ORF Transcript_49942/g.108563 Transcript_49942/m.108563 type:complete len:704 (+) Transcript_49942:65-2176(+)
MDSNARLRESLTALGLASTAATALNFACTLPSDFSLGTQVRPEVVVRQLRHHTARSARASKEFKAPSGTELVVTSVVTGFAACFARRVTKGRLASRVLAPRAQPLQSALAKIAKAEALEEDEDDDDVAGSACSIWTVPDEASIPDEILKGPAGSFLDKVKTRKGHFVRACRKGAKQVATLGPASNSYEMIEQLFLSGVDVFRLNFSHGEYEEKEDLIKKIREVEQRYVHPIGILADLQGPKQRCGKFADPKGVMLAVGQKFRFDLDPALGDNKRVQLPHPEILLALSTGRTLLLDDGKLRLRVLQAGCFWEGKELILEEGQDPPSSSTTDCPPFVDCEVEVGGKLSSRKGVNTPDVILKISPITKKDKADLTFACRNGDVDWIALSFVQVHEDMQELRSLVNAAGGTRPKLLAKIEKPSAVNDLAKILAESDGVMVARGDLGVEMNPEEVPFVQKDIILQARQAGKPVIVATQMLESMIISPTPTRAECSDVANAILDGCDAVMLSAETAAGEYPIECVEIQRRVLVAAERSMRGTKKPQAAEPRLSLMLSETNAIVASAATLAQGTSATAIICFTATGSSVERLVQLRPSVPILAICPCLETARWLTMLHGVYSLSDSSAQELAARVNVEGPYAVRFAEGMEVACRLAREKGLAVHEDDNLVVVARLPLFSGGPLNCIRLTSTLGPNAADGYGPNTGFDDQV